MKKLKLFFALSFVAVMSATAAMAQSAASTMDVTAELLSGLQITNVNALQLGSFVLTADAPATDNSFTLDPYSGNSIGSEIATVSSPVRGSFQAAGSPNTNVTITISGSVDLTHDTNTDAKFTLATAVDDPEFASFNGNLTKVVTLSALGDTDPIYVGGILGGIDLADPAGAYTGTIDITVAY